VHRLRDDATLRAERIKAGFARVKDLTWKKNAERAGEIYQALLQGI
jgi:hypothetical protein